MVLIKGKKMNSTPKKFYVTKTPEVFDENPWLKDLAVTIKKGQKITAMGRSRSIIDASTGEIMGDQFAIVQKKVVDKEEFIKIFGGAISGMFALSKAAQDLFKVVLEIYIEQDFMPDRIYLSESVLKKNGYTRVKSTRLNAINQLLDQKFLARMVDEPNWYWVNPNMIFKGDRLTLVNDYAIKGTASAERMEEDVKRIEFESKQGSLL